MAGTLLALDRSTDLLHIDGVMGADVEHVSVCAVLVADADEDNGERSDIRPRRIEARSGRWLVA